MAEATPFKPFDPNTVPATADPPPPAGKPDAAAKGGKRTRKPSRRKPKPRSPAKGGQAAGPKIPPAPNHKRPTRKKKTVRSYIKSVITRKAKALGAAADKAHGVRIVRRAKKPRELKLSFSAAMEISAGLKPNDFALFESVTASLQSVNKATRRRVLAAIAKVFG